MKTFPSVTLSLSLPSPFIGATLKQMQRCEALASVTARHRYTPRREEFNSIPRHATNAQSSHAVTLLNHGRTTSLLVHTKDCRNHTIMFFVGGMDADL